MYENKYFLKKKGQEKTANIKEEEKKKRLPLTTHVSELSPAPLTENSTHPSCVHLLLSTLSSPISNLVPGLSTSQELHNPIPQFSPVCPYKAALVLLLFSDSQHFHLDQFLLLKMLVLLR